MYKYLLLNGVLYRFAVIFQLDILSGHDQTLAKDEIEAAKKKSALDKKLRGMIREILWQVILLILICWVIYGNQNANFYTQNEHLNNLFISEFPEASLEPCSLRTIIQCN